MSPMARLIEGFTDHWKLLCDHFFFQTNSQHKAKYTIKYTLKKMLKTFTNGKIFNYNGRKKFFGFHSSIGFYIKQFKAIL